METIYQKRSVGCAVSEQTYDEFMRMATRRGITVSELVRYYIEEGLSNPTPREIRRLTDRLTTIEGLLKELYEMAVMNWAQVQHEPKKEAVKAALPWMPGGFDEFKKQLKNKGLVNEKTEKTAYEELIDRSSDWEDDSSKYELTEKEEQAYLREMWKADGSWTEKEEQEYREKMKRVPKYTRAKKTTDKPRQKTKTEAKAPQEPKKKPPKRKT
jgi:hypothetical protein